MMKYRVKEIGNNFYPQSKNDKENYVYVKYDNLNDAVDYCKKHKKENEIIIWEFSENDDCFLSKNNK